MFLSRRRDFSVVYGDCKIVGVNVPIFFANWKRALVVILNLIVYFVISELDTNICDCVSVLVYMS